MHTQLLSKVQEEIKQIPSVDFDDDTEGFPPSYFAFMTGKYRINKMKEIYQRNFPDAFIFDLVSLVNWTNFEKVLSQYSEPTDYSIIEDSHTNLKKIVVYNSTLVSQIMFTFGLSHE